MAVTFDASEVDALARDLDTVGRLAVIRETTPVVKKGAQNIKDDLVSDMQSSTHFKGIAPAISYDIRSGGTWVEAEIGPESGAGSPGNLANIAYFGSSRGGGTVRDPIEALKAEQPRFEKALADIVRDALS